MTDNIFEIETTALAHVAYVPSTWYHIERFCFCLSERQSFLHLNVRVSTPFPANDLLRQHHTRGICKKDPRTVLHGQSVKQSCPSSGFLFPVALNPSICSKTRSFQETLLVSTSSSQFRARMLKTLQWSPHLSEGNDRFRSPYSNNGSNRWAYFEPSEMLSSTNCAGVGLVNWPRLLFFLGGVQCCYYPRGSTRAVITAGDWMEWRAQSRRVTLTSCMDVMNANTRIWAGQGLEPSDVVCNEWVTRTRTDKKTSCTFTCQVSRFMCTVLVLVITSSLVSDVSSFGFTTHTQCQVFFSML